VAAISARRHLRRAPAATAQKSEEAPAERVGVGG
jgi:hypothetical protein